MGDFATAMKVILAHEGGWNPGTNDPGGPTNRGISLHWLRTVDPQADVRTIRNLTMAKTLDIYKRYRWDPWPYAQIVDERVCTKVFDMAVNMGPPCFHPTDPPWGHILLQRALNDCHEGAVKVDGQFGPKTLDAINSTESLQLLGKLISEQSVRHREIAAARPDLRVWLPGWLARSAWPLGHEEAA